MAAQMSYANADDEALIQAERTTESGTVRCAAKVPPVTWKLIVATEAPWVGEVYHTRPGHQRRRFDSVESFARAVLAVTGWPLHAPAVGPISSARPAPAARRRHSLSNKTLHENSSGITKFILAANEPWDGQVYRTRPGFGRLHFTTFEGFLRSTVTLTGWPLDTTRPSNPEAQLPVSQPA